jgi:hypothetical protein
MSVEIMSAISISIVSRRRGGGGVVYCRLDVSFPQIRVLGGRVVNNRLRSRAIGVRREGRGSELEKGTRVAT